MSAAGSTSMSAGEPYMPWAELQVPASFTSALQPGCYVEIVRFTTALVQAEPEPADTPVLPPGRRAISLQGVPK